VFKEIVWPAESPFLRKPPWLKLLIPLVDLDNWRSEFDSWRGCKECPSDGTWDTPPQSPEQEPHGDLHADTQSHDPRNGTVAPGDVLPQWAMDPHPVEQ
jgi:hypothetical protein